MRSSNTKLLAGIFAIMLLVALAPYALQRLNWGQKKADNLGIAQIKKETINKVVIKSGSEKVELKKIESGNLPAGKAGWKVESYDMSKSLMDDFLMSLSNVTDEGLVSKNKENQGEFGVDEQTGTSLTLYANNKEFTYVLGKTGSTAGSFYIRKSKEDNVYLGSGGLKEKTLTTVDAWREKTITAFDQKEISKIEVTGEKNFSLIKDKEIWKISGDMEDKTIKTNELTTILTNLSALMADGFLTDAEIKEFKEAEGKTTISVSSTKSSFIELTVWQKEENGDYFVSAKGKADFFKVSSSKLMDLFKLVE